MKLNKAGVDLVKQYEGLKLDAYPDPGTGAEPITIGYGHTGGVHMGDKMTKEVAEATLEADLEHVASKIYPMLKATISDNAFSALVSFAFNVGLHNLETSSLLHLVNAGNSQWAALEFARWNHAAGKVMPGLTARREAERKLFVS